MTTPTTNLRKPAAIFCMKRLLMTIIVLVIALVVVDLGAAYFIGVRAKQKFAELVAFLNKGDFATYEVASYQSGILKSEVVTNVKFKYFGASDKIIKVKHTILHGPLIFGAGLGKAVNFQMAVIKSTPMDLATDYSIPFNGVTVFKWNGDTTIQTNGSASIRDPSFQITSQNWHSQSEINKNWTKAKGDFVVPEVIVQVIGLPVTIKNLKLVFDQDRSQIGDWLGTVAFSVEDALQKEQNIEMVQFKFDQNTKLENQLIHGIWDAAFNKFVFASSVYGPLLFQMQILNIDPAAIKSVTSNDKNQQEESLRKILLKKPKLLIKPSQLTLPQGVIKVDGELSIGDVNIASPIDKDKVASTAEGYFHALVPKEILRQGLSEGISRELAKDAQYQKMKEEEKKQALNQQLDLKIQKFMNNGIMKEKDKDYEIYFTILKGKWMVNGKEIEKPLN